jgi:hypothetical protein
VQLPSFKPQQQITPGVEVVEQSKGDTSHIGDDRMVVSRDYTLTSFDEKVYVIPALNVKVNGKNCHGNQLALKVLTVPVDTVHPNQFYPPKDVQDNPFSWSEWSPLFWLSLLLLILCGAWLYLRNRLKNNKPIITHIRIVKRVPVWQSRHKILYFQNVFLYFWPHLPNNQFLGTVLNVLPRDTPVHPPFSHKQQ